MNELDKVKHLVSHWIEHGREHAAAYEEWAEKIQKLEDGGKMAAVLRVAAKKAYESTECLGTLLREHGHHEHDHDHEHRHGH